MDVDAASKNAGNCDLITREYFDSFLIQPRFLHSVVPTTEIELFGETIATPIMTAAMARLDNVRERGTVAMAEGIKLAKSIMWVGVGDEAELKSITDTGVRAIKIIKPFADLNIIFKQIQQARNCGVFALGMDIDHSFDDWKEYPMRSKTVDDMREIIKAAEIPFIVKGVLSIQDACKSVEAGAKAIVLSHHHGKMAYAVPPLMVLPQIVREAGKDITIIVDSGILSGFDAFKVLAMGANAVCVGRALLTVLKTDGAEGIQKKINAMTLELAVIMAKTGSPDVSHIDPSVLMQR
jgi:isopentenyl diphosphate isomerase/L-lactate dehydrogenase-like FMN-dependent dehydrogenase